MSRYSYEDIVMRIRRMLEEQGETPKAVQASVGLTKDQWSRKMRRSGNRFNYNELSAIADYFNAPAGWPFIDADLGRALERAEAIVQTMGGAAPRASPHPPASPSAQPGKRRHAGGK